jgi:N-acetylneuraminic acid mutarotase
MSTPREVPGVVSAAGRIFVVGGAGDVSGSVGPLQSSEVFDPNTNTWQPVDALLPVGRGSLSAERGPGNVILAFGGSSPVSPPPPGSKPYPLANSERPPILM